VPDFPSQPNTQTKSATDSYVEVGESAAERGMRDLYFLAKVVLGRVYPDLTEKTHKPICDFFVQKDPRKKFHLQDYYKNRLLIDPRGHFKTSIDICDCIQWMLCFPNVTILLASGAEELAKRMVGEMKEHFLSNGDFRSLYPDFVPANGVADFGTSGEFKLPNRTQIRREPTISISTIKSVKAGSHFDIRKGDDVVNEINSATAELNADTARRWSHTKPLLNPGGYTDLIGTFYDYSCLYGPLVDKYREGTLKGWKVSIRPSIVPDESGELFNPLGILFPERFCVDSNEHPEKENLQQIWRDDPELFNAQYQNEPLGREANQFPLELLRNHVIRRELVPSNVQMVCTWDLAFSQKRKSDYSVCALGAYDPNGNLYVVDIMRGRYTPSEIIDNLILSWRKWPVYRVGIEKEKGTALLGPGLHAKMLEQRIQIPLDMIPIKNTKDSVVNDILSLSPLLQQNKLWFVAGCSYLPELFLEFSRFPKYAHDDIPRAISLLLFYRNMGFRPELMPAYSESPQIGGAMVYGDGMCGAGIVA
jgi:predicted phage terminase large subunit-like protein